MNAIEHKTPAVERLEIEHEAFRAGVREIEAELERRRQSRDLAGGAETLLAKLDDFRTRIEQHFAFEERGWSRPDVSEKCSPSTQRWIEMLTLQHADFRRRLDEWIAALETSLIAALALPASFEGELSSLLADLTRHEFSESRLFQRSVFEDLGGFD